MASRLTSCWAPADERGVPVQRKEDRLSLRPRLEAEVIVEGEASAVGVGKVNNLSSSGICLATSDPIAPGRAIHIQLLVINRPISLVGETIWVLPKGQNRFEIGSWHVPDGPDSKHRLEQLLQDN